MHLDQIIAHKREQWAAIPPGRLDGPLAPRPRRATPGSFTAALRGGPVTIIAEVKPKSPSKGDLLPRGRALDTARQYAAGGARAVSVLADEPFFGGSPELVAEVAGDPAVGVPVLYKDFLVDPRQVELAHHAGAAAVLIIVRAVDDAVLADLFATAEALEVEALVETFTESDIERALAVGARIVGVNNRDLQTFSVDHDNAKRLRALLPDDVLSVSESGISSPADLRRVQDSGFHAALVGEALLTAGDPRRAVRDLLAGVAPQEVAS